MLALSSLLVICEDLGSHTAVCSSKMYQGKNKFTAHANSRQKPQAVSYYSDSHIARFLIFLIKQLDKSIRIIHYAEFSPCGIIKVIYIFRSHWRLSYRNLQTSLYQFNKWKFLFSVSKGLVVWPGPGLPRLSPRCLPQDTSTSYSELLCAPNCGPAQHGPVLLQFLLEPTSHLK